MKLNKGQKRLWKTLVFLLKLIALSIPLYIIIMYADLTLMQNAVAWHANAILNFMGFNSVQDGTFVSTIIGDHEFGYFISEDCTAWKSMLFASALVIATPAITWRRRGYGILFALPVIWMGNQARVIAVVLTENIYGLGFAMLLHDYLWRVGLIALVLFTWLFWYYIINITDKNKR